MNLKFFRNLITVFFALLETVSTGIPEVGKAFENVLLKVVIKSRDLF